MPIALESPDQTEVIALIAELDACQDRLYPPESRYALDLTSLMQPNVLFLVARDDSGTALGCGAMVLQDDYGEIKRMYMSPRGRGQGLGGRLLAELEREATGRGCELARLETGPYQPEALRLYESAGYQRRGPFGAYREDPLSVFMEKLLPIATYRIK
ncbi:GNAT family N-acetyltransferase [Pseudomonas oryzihabitans]|uniref:GNAT family N-acetyltransferase n=1 Tax=Pseudomonas oryzihabitans TaxID=47885 RepID=A0ABX3IP76_9PSED|nr:GNAT family N-acetyltransferase [Pseudomonas psychrotolerans]ONN69629.1 GNAT family N-acetyltransferase [Pseudomonas psychrotolerans]